MTTDRKSVSRSRSMNRRTVLKFGLASLPVIAVLAVPGKRQDRLEPAPPVLAPVAEPPVIEIIDAVSRTLGVQYWNESQLHDVVWARPVGADYVTWESLVGTAEAARQAASPNSPTLITQTLLQTITGNKILSLPAGIFEGTNGFVGTNRSMLGIGQGYATGCRGIVGSGSASTPGTGGAETIIRMRGKTTATGNLVIVNGVANPVVAGFSLRGNQSFGDNTYHAGLILNSCTGKGTVERLYLRGASPGYANYPPGETFGINILRSPDVTISDCEVDGRDAAGTRTCASPIGWNSTTNGRVLRVYCHHGLSGMLTFWQTTGVYTEDYKCFSTSSGAGILSGSGINHEQSQGQITHVRPQLILNGNLSGAADRTASTGLHMSLANVVYDVPANGGFQVIDPLWDQNYGSTGMFCFSIRDGYHVYTPGLENNTQAVKSPPTVIVKGVTLLRSDHPVRGWGDKDPAKYFAWVH